MSERKIPRDTSFQRQGISLAQWLWKLVDPSDRAARQSAGEAIQAMHHAVPSVHTDFADLETDPPFDFDAHMERFRIAVCDAVKSPGFDTAEFVRRLAAFRIAVNRDWQERCDRNFNIRSKRDDKYDRIADRLVDTINDPPNESEKEKAIKRFAKLSCGYICSEGPGIDPMEGAEAMKASGIYASHILDQLSTELLTAPEVIDALLDEKQLRHDARKALARMGREGATFAPRLIDEMDALPKQEYPRYDAAIALGSIGAGDAEIVDAMIQRLTSEHAAIRRAAADVLSIMGINLCGREAQIIPHLLPMLADDETKYSATFALASVGRYDAQTRQLIIDRARPRPAKMRSAPGFVSYQYDEVMGERGVAIDAIRYFVDYAEECVPVLIDAIETFEEYDPDEGYAGPVARIARALENFGPRAAAAAVPLAQKLNDDQNESPRAILSALAAMGPAAADALPLLEAFHHQKNPDAPSVESLTEMPDKNEDLAAWTIWQIHGKHA